MKHNSNDIPELIQRYCTAGADEESFRTLYGACKRLVFATAARLAPSTVIAEDLSQEIWLKLLHNICSFRGDAGHWETSFGAWLRRVALRTWLDMRKTSSERTQRELFRESLPTSELEHSPSFIDAQPNANPEALAEADELQRQIERAIQTLTNAEQAVFRARHFQDMPFKEIAVELGVTDGTVKTLHFRAMKKLQTLLKTTHELSRKP
jgi:RNA polymerase sigma factor (sigma-70 family)